MRLFLDTLINEYENEVEKVQQTPKQDVADYLRRLPIFGDFAKATRSAEQTNYGKMFLVESYRPAVEEIRKEVLLARELDIGGEDISSQATEVSGNTPSNNSFNPTPR
ncbi:MAG TPA: hypothetical protein VF546_23865 [Pyrinomonadaceae bacterium]|jgi:hypothetical protein